VISLVPAVFAFPAGACRLVRAETGSGRSYTVGFLVAAAVAAYVAPCTASMHMVEPIEVAVQLTQDSRL
jgi:hypothetical protein